MKKSIKDLGDIKGKRALIRVDVNVPLDADKNVTDDTRIQAILPTVKFLKDKGAKIILMAHLGRPKGEWNMEFSLAPVAKYLSKVLGEDVLFVSSPVGEGADKELEALKDGQVALAVEKNGKVTDPAYQVDGISGGTITSKGVDAMIKACLSQYDKFLTNN